MPPFISFNGSIILFIGLFFNEESPLSTESNGMALNIPLKSLIVVALFWQSRTFSGFERPYRPFPCTTAVFFDISISIFMPIDCRQLIVLKQSRHIDMPLIYVLPSAIADSINALCDIDLSPGTESMIIYASFLLLYFMTNLS